MSAVSSILTRLTAEQQEKVDRMINLQPRLTITQMTDALVAEGIPIKRSALGRYVKSVRDPLQKTASATSLAVIIMAPRRSHAARVPPVSIPTIASAS